MPDPSTPQSTDQIPVVDPLSTTPVTDPTMTTPPVPDLTNVPTVDAPPIGTPPIDLGTPVSASPTPAPVAPAPIIPSVETTPDLDQAAAAPIVAPTTADEAQLDKEVTQSVTPAMEAKSEDEPIGQETKQLVQDLRDIHNQLGHILEKYSS